MPKKLSVADEIADQLEAQTRFNVDISKKLNDKLNSFFPHGTKGKGTAALLLLIVEYVKDSPDGDHGVIDLLNGNLKLVRRE